MELRKAEAYIRRTGEAADRLGLAPGRPARMTTPIAAHKATARHPGDLLLPPMPLAVRNASGGAHGSRMAHKRRTGTVMQRAQETLAHKMGTLPQDQSHTDDALKDCLAMYEGPLPQDVTAALSRLCKLNCQLTAQVDDALVELGSQGALDLDGMGGARTPAAAAPLVASTAPTGAVAIVATA